MWGIWESYHSIPKAIFYLLKGDYIRRYHLTHKDSINNIGRVVGDYAGVLRRNSHIAPF